MDLSIQIKYSLMKCALIWPYLMSIKRKLVTFFLTFNIRLKTVSFTFYIYNHMFYNSSGDIENELREKEQILGEIN